MRVDERHREQLRIDLPIRQRIRPPVYSRVRVRPSLRTQPGEQINGLTVTDYPADIIQTYPQTPEVQADCGPVLLDQVEELKDSPRRACDFSPNA